jgi:PAS domain S-box-containing protein
VCVASLDLFGASYVTLGLLDRNDRTVQQLLTYGAEPQDWIKTGDFISGILETVVSGRRTLRGENPGGDPGKLRLPRLHPEVQAYLIAPLASPAHVYGWLCLVGNEARAFTEDEEHMIVALAGQVGRIYENGYFYDVAQKRTVELEAEISDRQQAESALRVERDRAQRYLDTAEVILLALDLDGRITRVNRYACSILGWPAEDLVGRDWIDTCLPPRMRDELRERFRNLVAGDMSGIEHLILTRSGEERLIEWHDTLLRNEAGQAIGTFSSGSDITERRRAQ